MGEKTIAILSELDRFYLRAIALGIVEFSMGRPNWRLIWPGLNDALSDWLDQSGGVVDGIITNAESLEEIRALQLRMRAPVVSVYRDVIDCNCGQVIPDDYAIGVAAARYFLPRGFRHFAFCGLEEIQFSLQRYRGFNETLAAAGFGTTVYKSSFTQIKDFTRFYYTVERDNLIRWLTQLPRPTALLAATDVRGRHVLMCCKEAGIKVPEEISVVGVDNDEVACELASPPLSSIPADARRTGFEAAALLDRIFKNESDERTVIRLPPLPLVERRSSDAFAIEDTEVAHAMEFIWKNASKPIVVDDVVDAVAVGRRSLETRFRKMLGRTIQKEIWRVHVEQAKRLLERTDESMDAISSASGFISAVRLSVTFRELVGQSPSDYRRALRGGVCV